MGDRVKEIRKNLDLNQNEFGAKLGVTGSAIARIEKGERSLTEQMRLAICREFGVDPEWLETGEGTMFVDNEDALDVLIDSLMVNEKETAKAVFKALARLGGDEWKIVKKLILDAAEELRK